MKKSLKQGLTRSLKPVLVFCAILLAAVVIGGSAFPERVWQGYEPTYEHKLSLYGGAMALVAALLAGVISLNYLSWRKKEYGRIF